ncbi:substrate-binding domain-containing protein [Bosea sp. (in: a-proteobacteria)]|uniref:substrate-binding domain-containing protein n=1 Tax=Bosea sp. (in: a-proteobacteria) TaxID=1871050 RepID=UPI002734971D|nr:substrate-binding domain-containing protein [Bosea sp. (in: a-proteobacteria)]MDP3258557.1 substrate-binding domain-containing protein [Bosea sp. (in: a-proteobacteria)]
MSTISLLSGGAAEGLVKALAPAFETQMGASVSAHFGAVGAMREKLLAGAPTDIVILTRSMVDALARDGLVVAESIADIGSVPTAVAIRRGDARPDVTTAPALALALRDAAEIYVPDLERSTAGIHFAGLLARLGLADSVARALRPHPNGTAAMAALAASSTPGALGCTQATEIIAQPGVELVGLMPDDLALSTLYSAALCVSATNSDPAKTFMTQLSGPAAGALRRSLGFSS